MNDLIELLIEQFVEQFDGKRDYHNRVITSHGQGFGNKWIIRFHDCNLEIVIRDKLYIDDPTIKISEQIYQFLISDPTCFEQIEKLIRA